MEYVVDRINTTSTVWMGLTAGCARCHDHKFDPISQKEFYQMFALFNNVPEPGRAIKNGNTEPYIKAPTSEQQKRLEALERRIDEAKNAFTQLEPEIDRAQSAWEAELGPDTRSAPSIQQGIVAHFPFDGDGNDLTENAPAEDFRGSSPDFVPAKVAEGVKLMGDAYLRAGKVGDFHILSKFSIASWVYPEDLKDGAILSRIEDTPERRGYELGIEQGHLQAKIITRWVTGVTGVKTRRKLEPNTWHHVAVTYDGSMSARGLSLYVDGEKEPVSITYNTASNTPGAPGISV